jgi:hypothetical protein
MTFMKRINHHCGCASTPLHGLFFVSRRGWVKILIILSSFHYDSDTISIDECLWLKMKATSDVNTWENNDHNATRGPDMFSKSSPVNSIKFGTELRKQISSILQITGFIGYAFLHHHWLHSRGECLALRKKSDRSRLKIFYYQDENYSATTQLEL